MYILCVYICIWQADSKTDTEKHKTKSSIESLEELNGGGNLTSGYQDQLSLSNKVCMKLIKG